METPKTTLWIPPELYAELMYYAHNVNTEIGGYGLIEIDKEHNDLLVGEVFLTEQEVHGSKCDLSAAGLAIYMEDLIARGEQDKIEQITLWWHSHVNMSPSHSGQDEDTMLEWPSNYVVSLVINRKGDMKARLMSKTPVIVAGDIDVAVDWLDNESAEVLNQTIEDKVKEYTPPKPEIVVQGQLQPTPRGNGGYSPYGWPQNYWGGYQSCMDKKPEKKAHELTDSEWKNEQERLDAEINAWENNDIEGIIKYGGLDEAEAKAIREMWD